jgi:hypothetical protein
MKLNTIQEEVKKSQSLMSKTGSKLLSLKYESPFAIPDDA